MEAQLPLPWSPFVLDVNEDAAFTVTDVAVWLQNAFFLPGDWMIWSVLNVAPELADFFELTDAHYGSSFSALISVPVWMFTILLIMTLAHYVAAADKYLTNLLSRWMAEARRHCRVGIHLLVAYWRRRQPAVAHDDGPRLSREERLVLEAHARIEHDAALSITELVRATGIPRVHVIAMVERLIELRLIDSRLNEAGHAAGSALTVSGRNILLLDAA